MKVLVTMKTIFKSLSFPLHYLVAKQQEVISRVEISDGVLYEPQDVPPSDNIFEMQILYIHGLQIVSRYLLGDPHI